MKTTVEINDPLLREACKLAARENTTLRALIEEGMHLVLAEKKAEAVSLASRFVQRARTATGAEGRELE